MEVGDKITIKCPRCKSSSLRLYEEFSAFDTYEIVDGVYVYRYMDSLPSVTGKTYAECMKPECKHRWQVRKSPIK